MKWRKTTSRRFTFLVAAMTAVLGSTAFPVLTDQAEKERTREEVKLFLADYLAVLEARDEAALPDMLVADGRFRWFTDGAPSYASARDVIGGMRRYAGMRFETVLSDVSVHPLGRQHASASATFRTELTIPGADDHAYGGIITYVLERDAAHGSWRILTGHTSTPEGPPRKDEDER